MTELPGTPVAQQQARLTVSTSSDVAWTSDPVPYPTASDALWVPTGVTRTVTGWDRLFDGRLSWDLIRFDVEGRVANQRSARTPRRMTFNSVGEVGMDLRRARWRWAQVTGMQEGALPEWMHELIEAMPSVPRRPWSLVLTEALG